MTAHANRGRAWEARLELWHESYRASGRAWIVKTHPPAKLVNGRIVRSRKAPPDFVGTVIGGRAVAFEAKDHQGARWNLGSVKPHQGRALEVVHRLGGLAFVALRFNGAPWVLEWRMLRAAWWRHQEGGAGRGEASITADDVAAIGLRMGDDGWLGVLL